MTGRKYNPSSWAPKNMPQPRFDEAAVQAAMEEAAKQAIIKHVEPEVVRKPRRRAVTRSNKPKETVSGEELMNIVVHPDPVEITFDYKLEGIVATIHYLHIPKDHRRKGNGTKCYKEWEAKLPEKILRIEVESLPQVAALSFWKSLGFKSVSSDPDGWNLMKVRTLPPK